MDGQFRNEFIQRCNLVIEARFDDAKNKIIAMYDWLLESDEMRCLIEDLYQTTNARKILDSAHYQHGPQPRTPKDVAAVGILLLEKISSLTDGNPGTYAMQLGIRPNFSSASLHDHYEVMVQKYISKGFEYLLEHIPDPSRTKQLKSLELDYPLEITESLQRFREEWPDLKRNAFLMMQFGSTRRHTEIAKAIRDTLCKYGIKVHRADDKEYHDDLFPNVLTYIYGCSFGIAVFERLEANDFNPNVSLEVGYMRALRKPICLLKDKTLATLQTDLVGKLYKQFDPQCPLESISKPLQQWLSDKDIIT